MAEKIFDAQKNYGWGLTFDLTGKAPAINKRIFNTYADAEAYANDFNDSAIEGLLLSVVKDNDEKNNGVYFVQSIKKTSDDSNAVLKRVASGDIDELKKILLEEINSLKTTDDEIKDLIGVIEEGKTVIDLIEETKSIVDNQVNLINEYTINSKKISENPVLDSNDLIINDNYTTLNQTADNIIPGDILTNALSKIEVMLANTTLAMSAAINDLESRIGLPSVKDENGNVIQEATGVYKKCEDLEALINNI